MCAFLANRWLERYISNTLHEVEALSAQNYLLTILMQRFRELWIAHSGILWSKSRVFQDRRQLYQKVGVHGQQQNTNIMFLVMKNPTKDRWLSLGQSNVVATTTLVNFNVRNVVVTAQASECNTACTMQNEPVCGTNGLTYGNLCQLESDACLWVG